MRWARLSYLLAPPRRCQLPLRLLPLLLRLPLLPLRLPLLLLRLPLLPLRLPLLLLLLPLLPFPPRLLRPLPEVDRRRCRLVKRRQ